MANDRRVRYTKQVLGECLIRLLKEKPLSQVTVSELCRMAEINRSTYYTHYANPYDQLEQMERELLDNLAHIMEAGRGHESDLDVIAEVCRYYWDNRELFLLLDNSNTAASYNYREINALQNSAFSAWEAQNYQYSGIEREYAYTYVIAGTNGVLHKWLHQEDGQFSPEQMAALLQQFIDYGLRGH